MGDDKKEKSEGHLSKKERKKLEKKLLREELEALARVNREELEGVDLLQLASDYPQDDPKLFELNESSEEEDEPVEYKIDRDKLRHVTKKICKVRGLKFPESADKKKKHEKSEKSKDGEKKHREEDKKQKEEEKKQKEEQKKQKEEEKKQKEEEKKQKEERKHHEREKKPKEDKKVEVKKDQVKRPAEEETPVEPKRERSISPPPAKKEKLETRVSVKEKPTTEEGWRKECKADGDLKVVFVDVMKIGRKFFFQGEKYKARSSRPGVFVRVGTDKMENGKLMDYYESVLSKRKRVKIGAAVVEKKEARPVENGDSARFKRPGPASKFAQLMESRDKKRKVADEVEKRRKPLLATYTSKSKTPAPPQRESLIHDLYKPKVIDHSKLMRIPKKDPSAREAERQQEAQSKPSTSGVGSFFDSQDFVPILPSSGSWIVKPFSERAPPKPAAPPVPARPPPTPAQPSESATPSERNGSPVPDESGPPPISPDADDDGPGGDDFGGDDFGGGGDDFDEAVTEESGRGAGQANGRDEPGPKSKKHSSKAVRFEEPRERKSSREASASRDSRDHRPRDGERRDGHRGDSRPDRRPRDSSDRDRDKRRDEGRARDEGRLKDEVRSRDESRSKDEGRSRDGGRSRNEGRSRDEGRSRGEGRSRDDKRSDRRHESSSRDDRHSRDRRDERRQESSSRDDRHSRDHRDDRRREDRPRDSREGSHDRRKEDSRKNSREGSTSSHNERPQQSPSPDPVPTGDTVQQIMQRVVECFDAPGNEDMLATLVSMVTEIIQRRFAQGIESGKEEEQLLDAQRTLDQFKARLNDRRNDGERPERVEVPEEREPSPPPVRPRLPPRPETLVVLDPGSNPLAPESDDNDFIRSLRANVASPPPFEPSHSEEVTDDAMELCSPVSNHASPPRTPDIHPEQTEEPPASPKPVSSIEDRFQSILAHSTSMSTKFATLGSHRSLLPDASEPSARNGQADNLQLQRICNLLSEMASSARQSTLAPPPLPPLDLLMSAERPTEPEPQCEPVPMELDSSYEEEPQEQHMAEEDEQDVSMPLSSFFEKMVESGDGDRNADEAEDFDFSDTTVMPAEYARM